MCLLQLRIWAEELLESTMQLPHVRVHQSGLVVGGTKAGAERAVLGAAASAVMQSFCSRTAPLSFCCCLIAS